MKMLHSDWINKLMIKRCKGFLSCCFDVVTLEYIYLSRSTEIYKENYVLATKKWDIYRITLFITIMGKSDKYIKFN